MRTDTDEKMERARAWVEARLGAAAALEPLAPGMGARRYWRVVSEGRRAVLMHAVPEDPAILPPALRRTSDGIPFVCVTHLLARHGLPVPELYAVEERERWVLLEDLGDRHLCDLEPEARSEHQREAIRLLARAHAVPAAEGLPFERHFDREWIGFELEHVCEHAVPAGRRRQLAPLLERLCADIASLPRTLCLRDYQSQNLMIDPGGRLRLLDYQDALMAPPELDLAAFLYDSYLDIPAGQRAELLALYESSAGRAVPPGALALLAFQRKLKDYARFRFRSRVKGDGRWAAAEERARQVVLSLAAALGAMGERVAAALEEPEP